MPLRRAYDFLIKQVSSPPPLAYPRNVIKRIHKCAEASMFSENSVHRSKTEKRLHNMYYKY